MLKDASAWKEMSCSTNWNPIPPQSSVLMKNNKQQEQIYLLVWPVFRVVVVWFCLRVVMCVQQMCSNHLQHIKGGQIHSFWIYKFHFFTWVQVRKESRGTKAHLHTQCTKVKCIFSWSQQLQTVQLNMAIGGEYLASRNLFWRCLQGCLVQFHPCLCLYTPFLPIPVSLSVCLGLLICYLCNEWYALIDWNQSCDAGKAVCIKQNTIVDNFPQMHNNQSYEPV